MTGTAPKEERTQSRSSPPGTPRAADTSPRGIYTPPPALRYMAGNPLVGAHELVDEDPAPAFALGGTVRAIQPPGWVELRTRRHPSTAMRLVGLLRAPGAQAGSTTLLTIHACLPTCRPRANPYCSNSSTVALNRNRLWASRPTVVSEIASTSPPPAVAIWSTAPSSPARAMPWPRCRLSANMQVIRQRAGGGGSLRYSRPCLSSSSSGLPYWHQPWASPRASKTSAA